jgi:catechol 2,3-dioxygenase-like lactoylglutathione lyase family enzyme
MRLLLLLLACSALSAQSPYTAVARLLWLVQDIDKATSGWAKTGNPSSPAVTVSAGALQARLATVRFANVSADFIQPLNSFPPFSGFLKQRGPGVYSLLYPVASPEALEAEKKRLAEAGVRLLFELTLPHPGGASVRYAFFDTAAQGKYVLGLTLAPPTLEQNLPRGMRVTQFAFAVRELEPVSAFWTRLGFPAMTYTRPGVSDLTYRGKPGNYSMRLGWQRHTPVPFEWIQPLSGPTTYHEHLEKSGEGFHHLAFNVDDMDAAIRQWESWGYPHSMGGAWGEKGKPGSGRFAYHDLRAIGGTEIELLWNYRAPAPPEQPLDFARLDPAQIKATNAFAHIDKTAGALTVTFRYAKGEPELRIPVAALGLPADWRAWKSLVFDYHATSLEAFQVVFTAGETSKAMLLEPLPGIRARAVIPFDAFTQTRTMTPLLPIAYKAWPQRLFTFERVDEIALRMRYPSADSQLTLSAARLSPTVPPDALLDRRPVIDKYGQWIPENWPGKAHTAEQLRALWAADNIPEADFPFCPLGGMASRQLRSTGFFRTEQIDGRWVFIDPHGHPFYSSGMDLVGYRQGSFATTVTGRESLFAELPPPGPAWLTPGRNVSFYVANIMERHGQDWDKVWSSRIIARLRSWGFNTIANWSDREVAIGSGMPYVLPLSGWTTQKMFPFPWDFPDVFSDEFARNVDEAARRQCAPLKDDPNLIGWFIGNEPHWARDFGSLQPWPEMLLADPEPSATQAELRRRIAARPADAQRIKDQFIFECGRKYFETIAAAIRRHDPNHLNLGIRFAGRPLDEWIRLSSIFDTFSINIYAADFRPSPEQVARFTKLTGRPVLIGEFTACAPGRGLQGLFYWVHKVKDHAERGVAYSYYVENAAADPNIIGSHWFQMVDDLPTGRPSDLERLNYGFLNVIDLPYPGLVDAARATHRRMYDIKFGKAQPSARKPEYN